MRFAGTVLAIAISLGAAPALVGCLQTQSKVADGQLYQSGDGRYDAYFAAVHQEQVAAANWPDESKTARKPIINSLNLRPGASNSTILSATRDKKGDSSLGSPVEQTTTAEVDLARRLSAAASRLEEMQKRGEELKKQTTEDKKNLGADKADEKRVAKKDEVKREMAAAVDAVESMADSARKGAKEAEELAAKLKAAWTGKDEDERPIHVEEKAEKKDDKKEEKAEKKEAKKPEKRSGKPETAAPPKKPAAKPETPSEEKKPAEKPDAPAKTPAQKAPDEVFNP